MKWLKRGGVVVAVGLLLVSGGVARGETLTEAISEIIQSNPEVKAQSYNRLARDEEVVQARSGYLPTLDLIAGAGVEDVQEPVDETYDPMQVTLKLRQNVFAGFSTKNEVARQKHRVRSMAYTLQATSENVALKAAKVYLEVLRNQELKALADQNLLKHQQIADQIGLRTESGVGSQVDSEQVRGRLALAQSNVVVTQTNLLDAMTNYQGVMGRLPGDLIKPEPPVDGMPASLEEAEKWAVDNHPTLKSAGADLDARHKQRDVANWTFMPIVDLELDQNWEDEVDQIDEEQQSTVAMVRLRYNLFNGLKDRGRKAETVQLVEEAREIKNNTHRQVIESIRLSWMAYQSVLDRIKYLEDHVQMTEATATAFSKQFDIGKRTLLDVLDTEAEAIDAKRDLINASYDGLYSQYRILNGTGGLVHSFGLKWPEESIVEEEENETEEIQDEGKPQTGGINQIRVGEMMVAGN